MACGELLHKEGFPTLDKPQFNSVSLITRITLCLVSDKILPGTPTVNSEHGCPTHNTQRTRWRCPSESPKRQPELEYWCFIWKLQSRYGKSDEKGCEAGISGHSPRRPITAWATAHDQPWKRRLWVPGRWGTYSGFAVKGFSVSPPEGGKKGNLSAHLPPPSISIARVGSTGRQHPWTSGSTTQHFEHSMSLAPRSGEEWYSLAGSQAAAA